MTTTTTTSQRSRSETNSRSVSFDGKVRVRLHLHKGDMSAVEIQSMWYSPQELQQIRSELREWKLQFLSTEFHDMRNEMFYLVNDEIYGVDDSSNSSTAPWNKNNTNQHVPLNEVQQHMLDLAHAIRSSSPETSPTSVDKFSKTPAREELQKLNAALLQALPTSPKKRNGRAKLYLRKSIR